MIAIDLASAQWWSGPRGSESPVRDGARSAGPRSGASTTRHTTRQLSFKKITKRKVEISGGCSSDHAPWSTRCTNHGRRSRYAAAARPRVGGGPTLRCRWPGPCPLLSPLLTSFSRSKRTARHSPQPRVTATLPLQRQAEHIACRTAVLYRRSTSPVRCLPASLPALAHGRGAAPSHIAAPRPHCARAMTGHHPSNAQRRPYPL